MKELKCPKCDSASLQPPAEGKRKWTCPACSNKFRIKSKDAGKILLHADEVGTDLGAYEPFLISAILEKSRGKKGKKKGKKKKDKASKKAAV